MPADRKQSSDAELVEAVAQFIEGRVSLSCDPATVGLRLRSILARAEAAEAALREARDALVIWGGEATEYARKEYGLEDDLHRIDAYFAARQQPAPVKAGGGEHG